MAPQVVTGPPCFHRFMQLPLELRNLIYAENLEMRTYCYAGQLGWMAYGGPFSRDDDIPTFRLHEIHGRWWLHNRVEFTLPVGFFLISPVISVEATAVVTGANAGPRLYSNF